MRKLVLLFLALPILLCGCERETLTDPVLFCESYNRISAQPIRESDAYLREENEFLLFTAGTIVRLLTNDDGAIHTAVVTGKASEQTATIVRDAFTVLAQPLSETVPQAVTAQCVDPALSVQAEQTKRFFYAVYQDGETITAVQKNLLLVSIPVQHSLRPSESE